ncbi:hypothetical protein HYQ44_008184 [Verticillium longisporum]|nr:hypothetical protein HYQ44_008184 [Verticillium longisporum]
MRWHRCWGSRCCSFRLKVGHVSRSSRSTPESSNDSPLAGVNWERPDCKVVHYIESSCLQARAPFLSCLASN